MSKKCETPVAAAFIDETIGLNGGAMGSPFAMTLANIYMWEWEHPLIEH
ncbi:unnamed protein product, partial [Rotaria sordida]